MALSPCDRCGDKDFERSRDSVLLMGQYKATLCQQCQNEWAEHCLGHRQIDQTVRILAREAHYKHRGCDKGIPECEWVVLEGKKIENEIAWFKITRDFVRAGKKAATKRRRTAKAVR